jgi:hypothetical protein
MDPIRQAALRYVNNKRPQSLEAVNVVPVRTMEVDVSLSICLLNHYKPMDTYVRASSHGRCRNCKRRVVDTARFCHSCAFPTTHTREKAPLRRLPGAFRSVGSYAAGTLAAILVIVAALEVPLPGNHTMAPSIHHARAHHVTAARH